MFWSIRNIDNYVTKVKGDCIVTYSIQGFNPEKGTITKHEVSIDNGETFKAIIPAGNDTGFSFKVNADEIMKRCYVRCEMTEKLSPQADPDSQLNPQEPKVITQTSNMFTVQYVDPNENNIPKIMNIEVLNENKSGTFEVRYSATDKDKNDILKHYIKVDKEEYKEITPSIISGRFSYTQTGLTGGTHICQIKVSDGKAEVESIIFNVMIPNLVNTPPTISEVIVSDMSYTGLYRLTYEANDIDIVDNLVHKLKIDEGEFTQITPIYLNNKFIYSGNGLQVGKHICQISISDKINADVLSNSFEVIIPKKESLKVKEELFNKKVDYDSKYKNVIDTINKVVNDMQNIPDYNLETGNAEITAKFDEYILSSVNLKDVMQRAIDSISSKKTEDAKESLNKEIGDLSNALGSLDNTMNDVFKDGILTEAEKITIKQALQRLSLERADVDNQYNSLLDRFNKVDLDRGNAGDEKKTWYSKLYNDLKIAYANYNKEYQSLLSVIDFVLNKEGIIDSTDKSKLDNAFDNYAKAINDYSKQANLVIEGLGRNESENNEVFMEEFKAEYIRNNKGFETTLQHLQQTDNTLKENIATVEGTANGFSSRVATLENGFTTQQTTITQLSDSISSKVEKGDFNSQITQLSNSISSKVEKGDFNTQITQLSGSISSKVSAGDIGSLIKQNADSVTVAVKNGALVTIDRGLTVWDGYIACDRLTVPTNHNPIITLFNNCAIDATKNENKGFGSSIRLKWDDSNYIKVESNAFYVHLAKWGNTHSNEDVFNVQPYSINHKGCDFKVSDTGLFHKGSGFYGATDGKYGVFNPTRYLYLGSKKQPWKQAFIDNGVVTSSDRTKKENICYLNDINNLNNTDLNTNVPNIYSSRPQIDMNDLYYFVKNDLNLCTFNFKAPQGKEVIDTDYQIGFIAQDIEKTKLGEYIITKDNDDFVMNEQGENVPNDNKGKLSYIQNNYINTLAGALQVAINKIDTLEAEIQNLKNGGTK